MTWQAEPNSPLGWAACSRCTEGRALVVQQYADKARCSACLLVEFPGGGVPGKILPVRSSVDPEYGKGLPVPAEVSTYPKPTITSRDGAEVPSLGPVNSLCILAESRGWYWDRQYAEGVYPHAITGRPGVQRKRSVKVRLGSPGGLQAAVAMYVSPVAKADWSWDFIWLWSAEGMTKLHGVTQLQDHLRLWESGWYPPMVLA